ncbi:MAG: hypothetical protein JWP19_2189 [Rhodoglobus sp.]|nr:hypothetical protein [Rhodoglobus sp.]
MPLTACLDERLLQAPFVAPDEWAALKGRLPRPRLKCGAEAVVKTSAIGTQFFAHYRRSEGDEHKGESPEHLQVKAAIMIAAQRLGWDARDEEAGPERRWIADVLVSKGDRRIAFEVQLAGQTAEEFQFRQDRYESDGVEAMWLVKRYDGYRLASVPALEIDFTGVILAVWSGGRIHNQSTRVHLSSFITALLQPKLRWNAKPSAHIEATMRWGSQQCYRCDALSVVFEPDEALEVHCDDCEYTAPGGRYSGKMLPPLRAMAALKLELPVATWHPRPTVRSATPELGFSCPSCYAPFYRSHLEWLTSGGERAVGNLGLAALPAHWCAPQQMLCHAHDVTSFLSGEYVQHRPPRRPESLSGEQLITAAEHRESLRKAERKAEEEGKRAAEMRSLARSAEAEARRISKAHLQRPHLKWGSDDPPLATPPPAPVGEAPTTPHERTLAIDAYTGEHLRHIDELRALFPLMQEECGCRECSAIHLLFTKAQRHSLWPHRGRARAHMMVPAPPS